ncbi:hypothetical protein Aperf_G00000097864 [Anoplocephala perfoliata]
MARDKATGRTHGKAVNPRLKPPARPRKKPVRRKRSLKKNESQLSYKDSHSIGRRKSTNVPTYNESGRLFYDLYVKYGPSDSFVIKEEKAPVGGFESDISDTTTVACNDNSGPSTANRKVSAKRRKRRVVKRRQTLTEPRFATNSRREASLNAEAKVNMLFESTKENKYKRKSLPPPPSTSVKGEASESGDKISGTPTSIKRFSRAKRARISEPLPTFSPPQKRLAGLNAMAIISACIKSPSPSSGTKSRVRRGRPPKSSLALSAEEVSTSSNANAQSDPIKSNPSPTTQTLSTSNAVTTVATVSTDAKVVPTSVVPTVERFQSRKVISYGSKCIGVENISRQIIHVPSQAQCVPGPSCSTPMQQPQQQCIFSPPGVFPPAPASSPHTLPSPPQNHSMIILPDSSFSSPNPIVPTDIHPYFTTNQLYLSPFSGHSPALQPHQTFYMSSPTVFHSIPSSSPFQFLSTTPFAYMQSSAVVPTTHTTNYMLPVPVYNTFSSGGFGGCIVPRPMFAAPLPIPHLQPQPQTSLVAEVGSPPVVHQPPQHIDRAVSPMPESGISTPVPTTTATINITSTPIKKASTNKKTLTVEKKPAPCLWAWVGVPSEKRVFLKPDSPSVTRLCYPSMRHQKDGMVVSLGDNVLLCSGPDRHTAPHVAKVTALFNDPDTDTKMMALLWYYRPESLVPPRRNGVVECELFASRHCDVNPVDCIDDRAYVLSAAPYARFMALAKYKQECRTHRRPVTIVPPLPQASGDVAPQNSSSHAAAGAGDTSEFPEDATPSNVFLCRAWYDFHSRRVIRHLKFLTANNNSNSTNNNPTTTTTTTTKQPQPVTSSSPVGPTASIASTLDTVEVSEPVIPLQIPSSEEATGTTVDDVSNGRAVLETTAELSINWADHGEQIAMSLGVGGGGDTGMEEETILKPSPSPKKKVKTPETVPPVSVPVSLPTSSSSS